MRVVFGCDARVARMMSQVLSAPCDVRNGNGVLMASHDAQRNFILQQGLPEPEAHACPLQYSALLFQPRIVGLVVLVAVAFQQPAAFFALAAALWLGAAAPRLNPFDALYNRTVARSKGMKLEPARPPRRFAQLLAGAFAIAIAACLLAGWRMAAFILEGILLAAIVALAFGAFCFGSFVFHVLSGRAAFAKRTLPWTSGVIILIGFFSACSQHEPAAVPPRTRDRLAELKTFDPTSPDVRPNPPVNPSTLGCYSVTLEPRFEELAPPREIELTGEQAGTFGFHQLYVVRSAGKRSTFWTWRPYVGDEVRVVLGNGFVSWSFNGHPVANGFDGEALWMNHTMQRHEGRVRMKRMACRES
jgi:hypothetical protein